MPSLPPPTPPNPHLRMLRVRDGLKDGLGREVTCLRLAVTEQCDLPCAYCRAHPGPREGQAAPAMSRHEVVHLARILTSLGIRKVRLTGGEPLLRRDLETLVAGISPEVEGRVHLATHGLHLARRARGLRTAGLGGVTVRLDAADRAGFERLTGRDGLARVRAGLEAARAAGLAAKVNAVVLRGWNDDQILPLARLAQQEGLQVRFIEFVPYPGTGWGRDACLPAAEILARIREGLQADLEEEPALGAEADPARLFRLPGSAGRVGVISTLSADFCDRCNRVRLTSSGELKACRLDDRPVDLLGPLRSGAAHEELVQLIRGALTSKRNCLPLRRTLQPEPVPGLWQVGG